MDVSTTPLLAFLDTNHYVSYECSAYHKFVYPSSVTIVQSRCLVQLKEPAKRWRASALPSSKTELQIVRLIWNSTWSFFIVFWLSWTNLPRGVAGCDSNPGLHERTDIKPCVLPTELISNLFVVKNPMGLRACGRTERRAGTTRTRWANSVPSSAGPPAYTHTPLPTGRTASVP